MRRENAKGKSVIGKMHQWVVAWLLAAGIALVAAMPARNEQQPLGRLAQMSGVTRQYMSCEETYGDGWTTCGSQVCASPLAQAEMFGLLSRVIRTAGLVITQLWDM